MTHLTITHFGRNLMKEVAETKDVKEKSGWVPLIVTIFSYLDNRTLKNVKSVCKNFAKLVSSDSLWIIQFKNYEKELRDFEIELEGLSAQCEGKKQIIKNRAKIISELEDKQRNFVITVKVLKILKKQKENEESEVDKMKTDWSQGYTNLVLTRSKLKMTKGLLGKRYADLPVLEVPCIRKPLPPKSMTDPIMKGKDGHGKGFIAIRARNKKTEELSVQIFFQLDPKSTLWMGRGTPIITIPQYDFIMAQGIGHESYNALKDLIEKGENELYKLD